MHVTTFEGARRANFPHPRPDRPAGTGRGWMRNGSAIVGAALWRAWGEYRLRRAAREMQGLSDRTLRDMGISRSEIDSAVRGGIAPERLTF